MEKTKALSTSAAAFWLFYEAANTAGLNASECARILACSRTNWYTWQKEEGRPYPRQEVRFRQATKLLRSMISEKRLPSMTRKARAEVVKEIAQQIAG